MRPLKLLLSAAVLSGISLVSIGAGFWAYKAVGAANQVVVQVPVAIVVGVAGMVGWLIYARRVRILRPEPDSVPALLAAFPVCALLVVGAHYLVTGYLTAVGNVVGAWIVLFVEVLVSLPIAAAIGKEQKDTARSGAG